MAMNTKLMKQVHASAQARAKETKRLYDEGFINHDQASQQMASHQQQAKMESVHQRKDGVALAREAFNAQMATKGSDRGPTVIISRGRRRGSYDDSGDEGEEDKENDGSDIDSDDDFLNDPTLDAIDAIRKKRMYELKIEHEKKMAQQVKGHGEYREIVQDEFLDEVCKSEWVICAFYKDDFELCQIMDKHLRVIAKTHMECKFVRINAEKAPFFVNKLSIQVLPTLVFFHEGKTIPDTRLIGFDGVPMGKECSSRSLEEYLVGMHLLKEALLPEDESELRYDDDNMGRGHSQATKGGAVYGFSRTAGNDDDDDW